MRAMRVAGAIGTLLLLLAAGAHARDRSGKAPKGKNGGTTASTGGGTTTSADLTCDSPSTPVIPNVPDKFGNHPNCQFYGPGEQIACSACVSYWSAQGREKNNHFCKDKSRSAKTPVQAGYYCYNYVEDTSHGYECVSYCPPGTPTCKDHCDQRHKDGSPCHDHPLRVTQNKNTGRRLGPPGYAPRPNEGKEERDKCNW